MPLLLDEFDSDSDCNDVVVVVIGTTNDSVFAKNRNTAAGTELADAAFHRLEESNRWNDSDEHTTETKNCALLSSLPMPTPPKMSTYRSRLGADVSLFLFLLVALAVVNHIPAVEGFPISRNPKLVLNNNNNNKLPEHLSDSIQRSRDSSLAQSPLTLLSMSRGDNNNNLNNNNDDNNDDDAVGWNADDCEENAVLLEDLDWRVAKLKLEEANRQRFLKSGPRYLPYQECRKWVIAFNRWHTEREWKDWIAMGEKRNAYIPARPDEYYGRRGQWISWDHFLGQSGDGDSEDRRGEFE